MTLSKFTLEAGTLGAAPAGDSIDGFTSWTIDGLETCVYASDQAFTGTKSIKIVPTETGHSYGSRAGFATPRMAMDVAFRWTVAIPIGDFIQLRFQNSASARIMQLHINGAGKIRFCGAGATSPGLYTAAGTVPINQWSRCKVWVEPGTTAANGKGKFQLWTGITLVDDFSTTTSDFGTALIDKVLLGNIGNSDDTYWIDLYGWDPAATTLLSNLDSNTLPTVTVTGGNEKTAQLAQITDIAATANDPDGTIASWAWTQQSGPATLPVLNATTATLRVNNPTVQGRYVWRVIATDNDGGASTPVDVTIYVPGSVVKVISQRSGTLVAVGAADLPIALSDADAATFGESGTNPTSQIDIFDLAPLVAGAVTINGVKAKLSAAGTGSCRVDLVTQTDTATSLGNSTVSVPSTAEVTVPSFTVPQSSIPVPNKLALKITYSAA